MNNAQRNRTRISIPLYDACWGSWGSRAFYRKAVQASRLSLVRCVGLVLLLMVLVTVIAQRIELARDLQRFYTRHAASFPTLTVNDAGIATATGEQPFALALAEHEDWRYLLQIDTRGEEITWEENEEGLALTREGVEMRSMGSTRRFPWRDARPLLVLILGQEQLSSESLYAARQRLLLLGSVRAAVITAPTLALLVLFLLLLFTGPVRGLALSRSIRLTYGQALRLCLFAMIPPGLCYTVLLAIDPTLSISGLMLFCSLLFSFFTVRGVLALLPQEERGAEDD